MSEMINNLKSIFKDGDISFQFHEHYGYINLSPNHFGTGLDFEITIDIPNVSKSLSAIQIDHFSHIFCLHSTPAYYSQTK